MLVAVYAARKSSSVFRKNQISALIRLLVFELLRNGESLGLIDRTGMQKGYIFV